MRPAWALSALLAFTSAAVSAEDPPRPLNYQVETAMPLIDLQRCATVELIRFFGTSVTPVPLQNGVTLIVQGAPLTIFGGNLHESLFFDIRDSGSKRNVTASYRHPMSERGAIKVIDRVIDKCGAQDSSRSK